MLARDSYLFPSPLPVWCPSVLSFRELSLIIPGSSLASCVCSSPPLLQVSHCFYLVIPSRIGFAGRAYEASPSGSATLLPLVTRVKR